MADSSLEITCRGCALLCDDLLIDDDQTGRLNCPNAVAWLKAAKSRLTDAPALPADHSERMQQAAELLKQAKRPLFAGWQGLSLAAETAAIQLAEAFHGYVSLGNNRAQILASQRYGGAACTWGEVRHRADLILCGQCDPFTTLSRFDERIVQPEGRFRAKGESARVVYLGEAADQLPAEHYSDIIAVPENQLESALLELRRLLADLPSRTNKPVAKLPAEVLAQLKTLAESLNNAAYPVLLTAGGDGCSLQWTKMVRETNDRSRLHRVSVPAGPATGNASESLLAWTGFPDAVRFSDTGIEHDLDRFQPETLIQNEAVDLLVFTAGELTPRWSSFLKTLPANLPIIALVEQDLKLPELASPVIALEAGVLGQQTGGNMLRSDGVPLPLRPFAPDESPSLEQLLHELLPT